MNTENIQTFKCKTYIITKVKVGEIDRNNSSVFISMKICKIKIYKPA